MKCLIICLGAILFFAVKLNAQYPDNLMFGFKTGIQQTSISNLSTILVSEDYYAGYNFSTKRVYSPIGSLFVNYRIDESRISLEGQLSYYQISSNLTYSDIENFTYTCKFKYHYLGIGANIRANIHRGINVGLGMRFGFNLQPENITYTSNAHEINWGENNQPISDKETQNELQDVVKGLNSSEIVLLIGYEFKNGLSIDLSYNASLNDMIETLVNRHNFINSNNKSSSFQITVGYAISVDKSKNDKRTRR